MMRKKGGIAKFQLPNASWEERRWQEEGTRDGGEEVAGVEGRGTEETKNRQLPIADGN
jgi:hypothetical protein